jgi:mannose-6-phosphate isomerase-like protein (cupin superfamily)
MATEPISVDAALDSFDDVYSPRILATVNDYSVRIAHARGEHVWHTHDTTDEFFLVLRGTFDIALREPDGAERQVHLIAGDVFVVPRGVPHRPSSEGGSILMFEPSSTLSTGDAAQDDVPDTVDSTTGRLLRPGAGRSGAAGGVHQGGEDLPAGHRGA